jgi:hypothetical protein
MKKLLSTLTAVIVCSKMITPISATGESEVVAEGDFSGPASYAVEVISDDTLYVSIYVWDCYEVDAVCCYYGADNLTPIKTVGEERGFGYRYQVAGSRRSRASAGWEFRINDTSRPCVLKVGAGSSVDINVPALREAVIGDVDGDGAITVMDAQYTLKYYTCNVVAGMNLTWAQILGKEG